MRKNKKNMANDDGFTKNQAFENQEIAGIDTSVCQYSQGSDLQPDADDHIMAGELAASPDAAEATGLVSPDEAAEEPVADVSAPLSEDEPVPDNLGAAAITADETIPANSVIYIIAGHIAGFFYDLCYGLGIQSFRYGKRFFVRFGRLIMRPLRYAYSIARLFVLGIDRLFFRSLHTVHEEIVFFRNEIRSSKKYLHQALKEDPLSVFSILRHYIIKAVKKHKEMFRTAANLSLPAAALVVLWLTVTYWNSVTFSLNLTYKQSDIGFVQDEAVYVNARHLANEQLGETADLENTKEPADAQTVANTAADEEKDDSNAGLEKPEYRLTLVKLNELIDESALFDNLLEESGQTLTNACGIFIDGKFIGAVKNETDATGVFDTILEPYKTNDTDATVAFVEDVRFTQGLYPTGTDMKDAEDLRELLTGKKQEASFYTVKDGDTIYKIAKDYGLSEETLLSMNPGATQTIRTGESLKVDNEVNYLRVKLIKNETRLANVDFEIIKTENPKLFKGDTRITQKGVPGQDSINELVTYIDGVRVEAFELEKTRVLEPVTQKMDVGTKSTTVYGSGGSYNVSVSKEGFVWPVPDCRSVSSPYGSRGRGFHNGIDIASSGTRGKIIVAAKDGVVESVTSNNSLGVYIVINHGGGIKTGYGHCLSGSVSVSPGQRVTAGQGIARVGATGNATGPHLHFNLMINGSHVNPLPYVR